MSFNPSKNSFIGFALFSGTKSIAIPKKMMKKITFSILPLSLNALNKLLGTISTKKSKGPDCCCDAAVLILPSIFEFPA